MSIAASQVAELRKITNGCGLMDCKKALVEAGGDMQSAVDILRKKGIAKATKRSSKITVEGMILIRVSDDKKSALMLELNCETDFVASDINFKNFAELIAETAFDKNSDNVEEISSFEIDGQTIEQRRQDLVAKLGENINLRRVVFVKSVNRLGVYLHGGRIGVIVDIQDGDDVLAKDIAMHIAATAPIVISKDDISSDVLDKEREIFIAQAKESGKPDNIINKMVDNRLKKYIKEISLLEQPFVKKVELSVGKLLEQNRVKVDSFVRFELGEGLEKKQENFAAEVMAQVKGKE